MLILNVTRNSIILADALVADTFFTRLKGLLGTKSLDKGRGLMIVPCSSIHTIGMKYAIDVLFIDQYDRIVKIEKGMSASKFSFCHKSRYVVELPAGVLADTNTIVGDTVARVGKFK